MPLLPTYRPFINHSPQDCAAKRALAQAFDQAVTAFGAARLAAALVARQP